MIRKTYAAAAVSAAAAALFAAGAIAQTQPSSVSAPAATRAQPASASLSDQDRAFMDEAVESGMMQVELGKLAAGQAKSPGVRQFARQSVGSFSTGDDMLQSISNELGVQLPREAAADTRKLAQALAADPAGVFDEEYLAQVVPASTAAVNLFESEAQGGQNPKLRQFAARMLPKVEQNRSAAVRIAEHPGMRQAMVNTAYPPAPPVKPR